MVDSKFRNSNLRELHVLRFLNSKMTFLALVCVCMHVCVFVFISTTRKQIMIESQNLFFLNKHHMMELKFKLLMKSGLTVCVLGHTKDFQFVTVTLKKCSLLKIENDSS